MKLSRSREENVGKAVGATSSEGLLSSHYYYFLVPLVLHSQRVEIKQIGEISGMVTLRTRKLKMSWPGILS